MTQRVPHKKFIIDHERRIFFSRREAQCVHLLSKGMSTKYIARELQLSPRTVEKYLECAKLKLDCYEKNTLLKKNTLNWTDDTFGIFLSKCEITPTLVFKKKLF